MNCPGEDVIAAFMQGTLAPIERSRMEEHLDVCPACTALLAGLGQVFGQDRPETAAGSREVDGAESDAKTIAILHVAMTLLHTWAAVLAAPLFMKAVRSLRLDETTGFDLIVSAFGLFVYAGLPVAWWAVHALLRRTTHAFHAARLYGILALFSVFATPFASYSLYLLGRSRVRARLTSRGAAR